MAERTYLKDAFERLDGFLSFMEGFGPEAPEDVRPNLTLNESRAIRDYLLKAKVDSHSSNRPPSIPESEWKWLGTAGHFIGGARCRFHLTTLIGTYLVSTIGEYFPRNSDEMEALGLSPDDLFESMVFEGASLSSCECCTLSESQVETSRYSNTVNAQRGHYELCRKYAALAVGREG